MHPTSSEKRGPGRKVARSSQRTPPERWDGRTATADLPDDRLIIATLRVRIPSGFGIAEFTTSHPTVTVEVLNSSIVSRELSVSDFWISGEPPGVWTGEIAGYHDVVQVDSLAQMGSGCLYRITYRTPPIIDLHRELGIPIQFPLHIQGGYIRWEVVARRSESEIVMDHARRADPNFQVVSIRGQPLRSHLPMLSDAQHELLSQAMALGYFAVPRGISLTELAGRLHRSKSGLSEALANIERKLLESALRPNSLRP